MLLAKIVEHILHMSAARLDHGQVLRVLSHGRGDVDADGHLRFSFLEKQENLLHFQVQGDEADAEKAGAELHRTGLREEERSEEQAAGNRESTNRVHMIPQLVTFMIVWRFVRVWSRNL